MSRIIKTHTSRNIFEIADILLSGGSFTCPTLPHYRYQKTRNACSRLLKAKLVERCGKTDTGVNLKPTDLLRKWKESGSEKHPDNWAKKENTQAGVE
jgi:hypothetical protein